MNPTVKRAGKRCRQCRNYFRSRKNHTRQLYCGRRCAAKARPRASRVAGGKKGGAQRAWLALQRREAAIKVELMGLTAREAFTVGRRWGRQIDNARLRIERRAGFSQGYEAGYDVALKELSLRSA